MATTDPPTGDESLAPAIYAFPGNEPAAVMIATSLGSTVTAVHIDHFPDGEARVRLVHGPADRSAVLVCSLEHPDRKILPLVFAAGTLRELGAPQVGLVAPYLAYMRQDRSFHEGEAVSAVHFAGLLSRTVDWLVTVEPHLHRVASLDDIYSIPTDAIHVATHVARWVARHAPDGIVIGPDAESRQWAGAVAATAGLPFVILQKTRLGSDRVEVSVPNIEQWRDRRPVLVDDIISTGHTLLQTVHHLRAAGLRPPVCVGIHALFAGNAYAALLAAGVERVATTTTIAHPSNAIDVGSPLSSAVAGMLRRRGTPNLQRSVR